MAAKIVGAAAVAGIAAAAGYVAYKQLYPGEVVETNAHGGELVASVLAAHGVKFLFTLIGGHISPLVVASEASGIRVVDVRHEATAVFAADAVARLTGVPGVAAVTAGPGLTNTITAVKNAQMAESPLVLLGGAAGTLVRGRGALQDIDQRSLFAPLCKYVATVETVRDIVPVLRQAFKEAQSGVPGPVFVEFPIDTLYPVSEVRANMGLSKRILKKALQPADIANVIMPVEATRAGLTVEQFVDQKRPTDPLFLNQLPAKLPAHVQMYLEWRLRRLFGDAFAPADTAPLPVDIPRASSSSVAAAVKLLAGSTKPVILMGSQVMLQAPRADDIRRAVDELGIPVFLGGMSRGLLGKESPLQVRQNRRQALKQADVVVMIGTVADFRLDYGRVFNRKSKIICVNRSKDQLLKNSDLFWHPTVASQSDPAEFLFSLTEAAKHRHVANKPEWQAWAAELRQGDAAKEEANAKLAAEPAFSRAREGTEPVQLINPLALCQEIDNVLPDNSILIGDGGDFIGTAAYVVRPRGPLTWLDPGAFGTLGVGGGFALGAKLCRPDAEVWLLWGDGSAGYSIAEYDTFQRHKTPVISVIGNDAGWTQIERDQVIILGKDTACPLEYTLYDQVAIGYGAKGLLLNSPTQNIVDVLREAQRTAASGDAVVVNAFIGKTNFREGSLSV